MCAKPTGFLDYDREEPGKRPQDERLHDYSEIEQPLSPDALDRQAARCMDCGIPFCHMSGCPLGNLIPDFNDMVYHGQWRKALELLHSTNNFPEITGRICPALCEASCTLSLHQEPVTIRQLELEIVERGWRAGWIQPEPTDVPTGKRVAIVGSGPAGLAAAQQLARCGHAVVVFEKADRVGGILRYGIPDFKLEKKVLERRLQQLQAEGVSFETNVTVGVDISIRYLRRSFDAVLIAGGARVPRDLPVPGRELQGIHYAMPFLTQQNRRIAGDVIASAESITAKDRHVVIIGGGDTGADCIGVSLRQGARQVVQLEILPKPPLTAAAATPWPQWPYKLRSSSSHEEGGERRWSTLTKAFRGRERVEQVSCAEVVWSTDENGSRRFNEVPDSEFELPADLVLLAMGFTLAGNAGILKDFGVDTDAQGQAILDQRFMSNLPGVFVAGDLANGPSLAVRAIMAGRQAADGINAYLQESQACNSQT